MSQREKTTLVPPSELGALQIAFVGTEAFLTYPRYTAQLALEASWMIPLISGMIALLVFLFINRLIESNFPGMDIVDITETTMGSFVASVVSIVLSLYFLFSTAAVMRLFMEHVVATVLPDTPLLVVGLLFSVVVAYIAYLGIEAICRTAYLLLPVLFIGIVVLCLLTLNWWHPPFLLPLWGRGIPSIIRSSFLYSSIYINVLLLLIIYPHATDESKLGRIGVVSIVSADLLLTGFLLAYNMVFPAFEGQSISFPLYQMARVIYIGRFFQRMESLFIFLWVMIAVVRMSLTLWAFVHLMARGLRWPTYKPGIAAGALLAFMLSLVPTSALQAVTIAKTYLLEWGDVIVFGIPITVTVLASLLKTKSKRGVQGV
ncbi:endospore germination permease [Alicyclobacillus sp. SO9]|uniref:GerAB/ArcD/ProY family transporter n=1 Tax=Alicyclobacillus sp. SO9 TaxID=2665646 RepID=UPI0018E8F554|nr:endospore germination permease [Alicyclobacillus sp. SO9]QQE79601.1 endospore germination permease [Alicyclobacillus sp. SO9]